MTRSFILSAVLLFSAAVAHPQLAVTLSPVNTTGSKTLVKLEMHNTFAEKVESARAVCFLLDAQGRIVGQSTKWVIGGSKERPPLGPDKKTTFYFVIETGSEAAKADVIFNRLVLEGGKLADLPAGVKVALSGE